MFQSVLSVFLLFLLMSFPHSGYGQSTLIGTAANDEYAISMCADNNGNTYIGGTDNNKALIIKQDITNVTTWSKVVSFSSNSQYIADIGFLDIIGDTVFGCGWIRTTSNTLVGCLYFKLNAQTGATYWIKSELASEGYFSCMRYVNGKYLLVGGIMTPSGTRDGKVIAVSSQTGQVLWETPRLGLEFPGFGVDYLDDFIGASKVVNGQLFITGRSYVDAGSSTFNMRPLLIGVNETGTVFLHKYLMFDSSTPADNRFYGQRVEFEGTDSLVVAYVGDDNCSSCSDFKSGILTCDLQGNVAYERYYDIQGVSSEIVRSLNVTPTGYVIYGQVNTGMPDMRLFLLKVSKQGTVELCRLIGNPTGVYTVYSGLSNFSAGNNSFVNGLHYFVATSHTGNATSGDIKKIIVDDSQLYDPADGCATNVQATVTTTSFTPFSGPLDVNTTPVPYAFSNVNGLTDIIIPEPCAGISISFNQQSGCGSTTITATAAGASNASYSWSNGSFTDSTVTVTTAPLIVTVSTANCCIVTDTVVPVFQGASGLSASLPADTTLCLQAGAGLNLAATVQNPTGAVTYTWSTSEHTNPIAVTASGNYWVAVADNCSTASDTITVQIHSLPAITLAATAPVCTGDFPFTISPVVTNAASVAWNDGTTTNDLTVAGAGTYTLTATNTCGSVNQSIAVSEVSLPQVQLVAAIDTCIQTGQSVLLIPVFSSVNTVSWSDGNTGNQLTTQTSGQYTVTGSNQCGSVSASCDVTIHYFPELYLPAVLDTCFDTLVGFAYMAHGTPGNYQWSSGSSSATEFLPGEGAYTCTLTNSCGSVSQTMTVNRLADIDLLVPEDSLLVCLKQLDIAQLQIETNYALELHSPTGQLIGTTLNETGWYAITAYNSCGALQDSIFVDLQNEQDFYLPNAFTPNTDGYNEAFVYKGTNIVIQHVRIFNRWGEQVYSQDGDFTGWDGTDNGKICPDGIYAVQVIYADCAGIPSQFNGHVSLLK